MYGSVINAWLTGHSLLLGINIMPHIFISYAREDRKDAEALSAIFDSEGFDVWWDARIYVGQKFADLIEEAIEDCQHVIVLWTPFSVKSEWVQREANLAKEKRKLLPVQLRDCDIPNSFMDIHTIRFKEKGWGDLLAELFRGIDEDGFTLPSRVLHCRPFFIVMRTRLQLPDGFNYLPEPYKGYQRRKFERLLARKRRDRRRRLATGVAIAISAMILAWVVFAAFSVWRL
jgi:hypothetical protein